MSSSEWIAVGAGLTLLFWIVGAYNRLVRLRADASRAFAALDAHLVRLLVWVQSCLPESLDDDVPLASQATDEHAASWRRLSAASEQFASALAQARGGPLESAAVAGLLTAYEVLSSAWGSVVAPGREADNPAVAERRQARYARLQHQAIPLALAFNQAVRTYNQAVAAFPALLVARLFGFRPATALSGVAVSTVRVA